MGESFHAVRQPSLSQQRRAAAPHAAAGRRPLAAGQRCRRVVGAQAGSFAGNASRASLGTTNTAVESERLLVCWGWTVAGGADEATVPNSSATHPASVRTALAGVKQMIYGYIY